MEFSYDNIFALYSIGLFFGIILSFIPFSIGMIVYIFKRIISIS